jgi:hypothetical protein
MFCRAKIDEMTRREAALACAAALSGFAAELRLPNSVRFGRVPAGGIQPRTAIDSRGFLHLVYYVGDARHGDLFYVRSTDGGVNFSAPLPVNQSGSAIAAGTIRGAQLALGKGDRVHVCWNGSSNDGPLNRDSGKPGAPMLYSRLNDSGTAFEPQRNLMLHSFGLDGGGSIAADRSGNVYVAWHGIGESEARGTGKEGEARRSVWVTKSEDGGRTFSPEKKAWTRDTGACGCCGMKIFVDGKGDIFAMYRSATESVHRDIYLLSSNDRGRTFQGELLHKWNVNACPMSSVDFAGSANAVFAAWETAGQIYWTRIANGGAGAPIPAPGEAKGRKHPRLAVNADGSFLIAWAEGAGWAKRGSLAFQMYDASGQPGSCHHDVRDIPIWSFAAAVAARAEEVLVLT